MAVYRAIYMSFWTDEKVDEDFSPEDKYFMLYALSNPHTRLCGCYGITIKQISQEMGYSRAKIEEIINRFQNDYEMIFYDHETRELFVKNWRKYNWTESPKLDKVIRDEIISIKSRQFKAALIELYNNRQSVRDGRSISIDLDESYECQDGQIGIENQDLVIEGNVDNQNESQIGMEATEGDEEFHLPVEVITKKKKEPPYDEILKLFVEICTDYPKPRYLGKNRKSMISARWFERKENIEIFREVFINMENSDFLKGNNNRNWKASFDWAMNPDNFNKILEGNYENRSGRARSGGWNVIQNEAQGG